MHQWHIPRIVSGLVHPNYKWINPTYPVYNWGYNPLTIRGMSHQVDCHKNKQNLDSQGYITTIITMLSHYKKFSLYYVIYSHLFPSCSIFIHILPPLLLRHGTGASSKSWPGTRTWRGGIPFHLKIGEDLLVLPHFREFSWQFLYITLIDIF